MPARPHVTMGGVGAGVGMVGLPPPPHDLVAPPGGSSQEAFCPPHVRAVREETGLPEGVSSLSAVAEWDTQQKHSA